jgi:hypothetical protein
MHEYKTLTSVDDILYMSNEMGIKLKCFFTYPELRNYLNKYKPNNINIIFNIINNSQSVGHWCVIKIINGIVIIFTCFGIIYRPLNEMFYKLGYYKLYYIVDQKQTMNNWSCGYICLLFLATFKFDNINEYNYIYYNKNKSTHEVEVKYNFIDFDIKKYIKYQKILLETNNMN